MLSRRSVNFQTLVIALPVFYRQLRCQFILVFSSAEKAETTVRRESR